MKTLTQSPATGLVIKEFNQSQHTVSWGGRVVGMIQCSPELGMSWEYGRYSEYPKAFVGTYEECVAKAEQDYAEATQSEPTEGNEPCLVQVIEKGGISKPSTRYGYAYGSRGRVQRVTIGGNGWTDELWVPVDFARKLKVGTTVESYEDMGAVHIRLPKRPVRRSEIAA